MNRRILRRSDPIMGLPSWVWASPPDPTLLALVEGLAEGDLPEPREVLKHNRNRTVWLLPGTPAGLILKHYRRRAGEGFKTWLMGGRAEREFRAMEEFCRAGLPTARPVGFADEREDGRVVGSWFLSKEVVGARTVRQHQTALAPGSERALALALRVMDTVAQLHTYPVWHRDLHVGNLLLGDEDQIVIIDLHSLWRVPRLTARHRFENLARAVYSMKESIDLGRMPELAARYAERRGDDLASTVDSLRRALTHFADDHVRGRSARCMRDSSEYVGSRNGHGRLHRRRVYEPELLDVDIDRHEQAEAQGQDLLQVSRASSVSRARGPDDESGPRIVKHFRRRGLGSALRGLLGLGRARGVWRFTRRCRVLDIPTPEALALLERPDGSAWVITREVPGAITVTDWAEALRPGELGVPDRRGVAWGVGHAVGLLSRAGLRHADLSAKNVLVSPGPAEPVSDLRARPEPHWPRIDLIDLDNMRRCRPHDPDVLIRMLGQFGDLPEVITATDRLRFLRGFQRASGRDLPPAVVAAAMAGTLARQERRARLQAARRSG
jgi:tRNA A-37 threonylcarbamoyl transferase component Bud32